MKPLFLFALIFIPYRGICQDSAWHTITKAPGLKKGEFYKIRGKDTVTIINPEADNPDAVWLGDHGYVTQTAPDSKNTNTIMRYVEQMPIPGYNLEAYLANITKCPASQFNTANKKRVSVQFLVKTNGSITGAKVVTHLQSDLDAIALQVISTMPKWKPGKQNGKPVDVYYTLPFYFDPNKPTR